MELKGSTRDVDQAIEAESLVKCYGELVVVDGLSLRIPRSQVLGLFGPNSLGKAMTISCILQLLTYDEGAIRAFGQPMTPTAYGLKRRIGVVSQDVAAFDELTMAENINTFCALYVRDHTTRRRLVDEVIAFVDLEKFVKFKPKRLPGGLPRRLSIVRSIAHGPDLIIPDEPTVAVDPQSRNAILDGTTCLNEQGATIIYTNHYMGGVERPCHRIVIIDRGGRAASSTSDELEAMVSTGKHVRVEIADPVPLGGEALRSLRRLEHMHTTVYREPEVPVEYPPGACNLFDAMEALAVAGAICDRVTSGPSTLNNIFLEIIGQALRGEVA